MMVSTEPGECSPTAARRSLTQLQSVDIKSESIAFSPLSIPATTALHQIINNSNNSSSSPEQQQQQQQQQHHHHHQHRKGRYSISVFPPPSSLTLIPPNSQTPTNHHHHNTLPSSSSTPSVPPPPIPPTLDHRSSLRTNHSGSTNNTTNAGFLARYLSPSPTIAISPVPSSSPSQQCQIQQPPSPGPSRTDWNGSNSSGSAGNGTNNNNKLQARANTLVTFEPSSHHLHHHNHLSHSTNNNYRYSNPISAGSSSSSSRTANHPRTTINNHPNNNNISSSSSSSTPLQVHHRGRHEARDPVRNLPSGPSGVGGTSQERSGRTPTGQLEAKVVILGMQGVGKTSIVHRYTTGSFSYSLTSTIGASFCTKKLSVDGCKVRLQIWDTAGQERFRSMAPMYYRGANAAILVYDITNHESFLDIQNWLEELRQNMTSDLIIQIVGSKADLSDSHRSIDLNEAYQQILKWTSSSSSNNNNNNNNHHSNQFNLIHEEDESFWTGFSQENRWNHVGITEVSAKDDVGIEDLFLILTRRLVLRKVEIDEIRNKRSRDSILIDGHLTSDFNKNNNKGIGGLGLIDIDSNTKKKNQMNSMGDDDQFELNRNFKSGWCCSS